MPFPPILAHGALGIFDELLFFAIGIIFFVMMGVSWYRSRNLPFDDELDEDTPQNDDTPEDVSPEHFNLK